ncbi:hypothetical protein P775_22375 [Puniceibacterium antarcticum]|uniref:DUF2125 domain-containing protein n=1 Tax=Puniceibacterium antarcticum TaxID=1206336 RepID=A0A2G8R8M1_9RHOB|nr:DUF2125 domain-containing protein [Puniceibacterium antarcticum]PIL17905.1 hypothetical protein P775_22375 [Puniceibacterium antarcticum]
MKRLLFVTILAGLAWTGHWFWSAHSLRQQTDGWFAALRSAGWTAQYDDVSILGFPNRLDQTFTDITLTAPEAALTWQAPFLQVFRLSYNPSHLILIWPEDQTLTTPAATTTITDKGLRASLILDGGEILRSNLEAAALTFTTAENTLALTGLTAALTHIDGPSYRLALNAEDASRQSDEQAAQDPGGVVFDATVTFDRLFTTTTLNGPRPQPQQIALRLAEYRRGDQSLKLSGDLTLDDMGRASGTLSLQATRGRDMLALLHDQGALPLALFDPLEQALTLSGNMNGSADTLDLTLKVYRGTVSLGLIPLGQLPPLRLP